MKWLLPLSDLFIRIRTVHFSLFGSQEWGREWVTEGRTTSWAWRGQGWRSGGTRLFSAARFTPADEPCCDTTCAGRRSHAASRPPCPLGACSGQKNIRLKLLFKLWLQKCVFFLFFLSGKCYMCILLTCNWREEHRPVTFSTPPVVAFAMHSLQR